MNLNPNNIKEVIIGNYDPSLYPQELYPDIQYYCVSNMNYLDTFAEAFNSSNDNKKKYSLINTLINKDTELTKNAINMQSLIHINKLTNLLLNIYSLKISREDAKKIIFKKDLKNIIETYNKISNKKITEDKFIKEYFAPFIKSWNNIKDRALQYKCRMLRNIERGEKPLDMDMNSALCYFLVDDGDKEGGMFLAAAYENFIQWQNQFIDDIISKNSLQGILNGYISQLEMEINVQDAVENDTINIDENIYERLNHLISSYSIRNIFNINEKNIYYKNYNEIIYNYDLIEEELAKLILPGIKKFKKDKIKFITYLYEGFRGRENSSILVRYDEKYGFKELSEEEKNYINKIIKKINNNKKIYNDIFSSLQILMNEILKENFQPNDLIINIIKKLPNYVILNEELINLINNYSSSNQEGFTVNSLISLFEYF